MAKQGASHFITRDMALVMIATFCFMVTNMLANPLVAGYAESLGAPGAMMGVVAGVMSLVSLFCRPIAGNLSDKTSKRALAAVGTLLYFLAGLLYCFANSPAMLIAARVVNGLGFACCSVCLATWMSLLLPLHHMGAGMGLYGTVNALAMAVGPAIGIRLKDIIGYHLAFLGSLILPVIMIVAVMLVRNGGQPVAKPRATTGRFSIRTIVEPRVVPLSLSFMMFAIPYFVNQAFIVNYVQSRHLAVSSDLFFTFYAIALLVMRLTMRNLFDRKGFRFWMVVCSLSMIATLSTLTFMSNNWFLLFAGIFMAASYGLMSSVTQAQAVVIAGRERSGIANSTYYMGLDLGMALGPMLAGIFYGRMPISWLYPAFMLTMPLAWIIYLTFARTIDGGHQAASGIN